MQSKIVVGYDGSEHAQDALALARRLAEATDARLILANVYPGRPEPDVGKSDSDGFFDILQRDADRVLHEAPGHEQLELRTMGASSPARGLHDAAEETGASMLVVGSAHRGKLGHIEAGHTAEHLLNGAPCAVAVAPVGYARTEPPRHGRIAVGFDGSPEAGIALDAAIGLARTFGALLRVVVVADPVWTGTSLFAPPVDVARSMREEAKARMDIAQVAIPEDISVEESLIEGDVSRVLSDQPDCDLVVMGSRGYGRVKGVLLGSVSGHVVRGGSAPVMVVPRGVEPTVGRTLDDRATAAAG